MAKLQLGDTVRTYSWVGRIPRSIKGEIVKVDPQDCDCQVESFVSNW